MNRYRTIDSLRGLAAMSVVFYHLSFNLKNELSLWMPDWIVTVLSYGFIGVPVFFVISGFVISQSVAGANVTFGYVGNFALRRAVRLDPPYWASIAIAMVLLSLKNMYQQGDEPYPSLSVILAHLFYLQDFLELPPIISEVYWTLCMEVQLYLFFILSLAVYMRFSRDKSGKIGNTYLVVILVVGVLSVLTDHKILKLNMPGLFLPYWHYFMLGVLLNRVVRGESHATMVLFVFLIFEIAVQLTQQIIKPYVIAAVLCCGFIYASAYFNSLDKWLVNRYLLFLGKISYCLYLLHPDIAWKFISLGKQYFGANINISETIFLFLGGMVVSILAAVLLNWLVETPSLNLAKRLKRS